jgi:hypothetical protein
MLPYAKLDLDLILTCILEVLPPLHNLVCIEITHLTHVSDFAYGIHLLPTLHSLTVPLLNPEGMQAISPSFQSLLSCISLWI